MALTVIKIVSKDDPAGAAQAQGELKGSGFSIAFAGEVDAAAVDATRAGSGVLEFGSSWIIVGTKP